MVNYQLSIVNYQLSIVICSFFHHIGIIMKKIYKLLFLLAVTMLTFACSSGYKAMKKGDYYKAVIDAVDKLRSSPRSDKAGYVLTKAYPMAVKAAERDIAAAIASNSQTAYETVVYEYERINQMANAIYKTPRANELIPEPVTYHAELTAAREKAAAQFYDLGLRALDAGTLEQGRYAYQFFNKTNEFHYGYRDVLNLIEEARFAATLRVVVEKPLTGRSYQLSADFFSDELMSEVSQYLRKRFIRFYNFYEYQQNRELQPHQFLVLNFEDFSIGNVRDTKNTVEMKSDSVKVGTATVNGKKVDVYNVVTARYHTYRREIKSGGVLSVRIFDGQNRLIQQRNFAGEYVWYTTWASYNGDERALTAEQKNSINRQPQIPPSHQQLFVEFTKPIYSQAVSYIKSYYNRQ